MKNNYISPSIKILLGVISVSAVYFPSLASATLINGDFATGDLTGWTTTNTVNGTNGYYFHSVPYIPAQCQANPELQCQPHYGDYPLPLSKVFLFDTKGNGASNSAMFNVASTFGLNNGGLPTSLVDKIVPPIMTPDGNATYGGGLTQDVLLASGILNISVDVAASTKGLFSRANPSAFSYPTNGNSSAGIFSLIVNNNVVSSYNPGAILAGQTLRDTLTASVNVNAGLNSIGILVTRPYPYFYPYSDGTNRIYGAPDQFVDNFTISGSAVIPTSIPEPFSIVGTLIGGAVAFGMRRKLRQMPSKA